MPGFPGPLKGGAGRDPHGPHHVHVEAVTHKTVFHSSVISGTISNTAHASDRMRPTGRSQAHPLPTAIRHPLDTRSDSARLPARRLPLTAGEKPFSLPTGPPAHALAADDTVPARPRPPCARPDDLDEIAPRATQNSGSMPSRRGAGPTGRQPCEENVASYAPFKNRPRRSRPGVHGTVPDTCCLCLTPPPAPAPRGRIS